MRISDWSSDVCSSDLPGRVADDGIEPAGPVLLPAAGKGQFPMQEALARGQRAAFVEQRVDARVDSWAIGLLAAVAVQQFHQGQPVSAGQQLAGSVVLVGALPCWRVQRPDLAPGTPQVEHE